MYVSTTIGTSEWLVKRVKPLKSLLGFSSSSSSLLFSVVVVVVVVVVAWWWKKMAKVVSVCLT